MSIYNLLYMAGSLRNYLLYLIFLQVFLFGCHKIKIKKVKIMFEKKKSSEDELQEKENNLMDILSKMLELEKEKHKVSPIKITICVVGGIGTVMFVGLLCYRLVKTDFSFDSILSTLLAFFSIFISIFFYFKADETSTNFYKSSYDIMKDVSVTLGKIEERFGEKLNSLNDKVSHLDNISSEKSEEIKEQKDDKDKIINELMDKAHLDEEEKKRYRQQLEDSERQIEILKREQFIARREADRLRLNMESGELQDRWEPNNKVLMALLNRNKSNFSMAMIKKLIRLGYLDDDGNVNEERIINTLAMRR